MHDVSDYQTSQQRGSVSEITSESAQALEAERHTLVFEKLQQR